jgi:signal transduction histidine kinase
LEFRIRLFNVLAIVGTVISLYAAIAAIPDGLPNVLVCLFGAGLSVGLMVFASLTKRYVVCYFITIIAIFLGLFPMLFFISGGYAGSIPYIFILAIVFTVIMLEHRTALIMAALELIVYVGLFVFSYQNSDTVVHFATEEQRLFDVSLGMISVGSALALTVWFQFRLYNRQHKQLEDANKRLGDLDRMKTEFLQDMRHEMKNPLTTIARGIEFAESLIDRPDKTKMAHDALNLAQEESLRVGRMVDSMINLATMTGGTENREKVNFESLLVNCAETFRLQLDNRENTLDVEIDPGLPYVYGVTDQLKQVLINLFQNTAKHTRNSAVTLKVSYDDTIITVRVSDTGEGIPPEILAHVFERGFSGKESSGYGLSICRTIVEAHGGNIDIESEPGKGTAVTFTIPVYGGQSETRDKNV